MTGAELIALVSSIGSLLTGVGTLALAMFGNTFIKSKQFEHKFELAKKAILTFSRLKNDIQQVRSPIVYDGELKELANLEETNDLIPKMKKYTSGGIVFLRLNKRLESLAELNRLEAEFQAIFGDVAAFEEMRAVRHKLWVAAHMICTGSSKAEYDKVIYAETDDDLEVRMSNAYEAIKKICNPILRETK